jgi:hypothetical protein
LVAGNVAGGLSAAVLNPIQGEAAVPSQRRETRDERP